MNWKFWQRPVDLQPEILRQIEALQGEVATVKGVLRFVPAIEDIVARTEAVHNRITELQGIVAIQQSVPDSLKSSAAEMAFMARRLLDWSEKYDRRAPALRKSAKKRPART